MLKLHYYSHIYNDSPGYHCIISNNIPIIIKCHLLLNHSHHTDQQITILFSQTTNQTEEVYMDAKCL